MSALIGILGGSFDPIHNGHIRAAVECLEQLSLTHIHFIPCHIPAHKELLQGTVKQRVHLLTLALKELPHCTMDLCEIERPGPSYMVDTLSIFKERFPYATLCLIVGSDAFATFHTWKQSETILTLAHLIVVQRIGDSLSTLSPHGKEDLHKKSAGCLLTLSIPTLEISSTEIREKCRKKHSIQGLVPDAVGSFIRQEALYEN